MTKRTLVVNFYGGPGAGKSTMAFGVAYKLKLARIDCELVTEVAKDMIWEGQLESLKNQTFVTSAQHQRVDRLINKVDVIVSDAPFLLGVFYAPKDYPPTFMSFFMDMNSRMSCLNYFLTRPDVPYDQNGRKEHFQEALGIDGRIHAFLDEQKISCREIQVNDEAVNTVLTDIQKYLSRNNPGNQMSTHPT